MATQVHSPPAERPLSEQESLDFELVYLLECEPHLTQREIAERLGISLGRVNYSLKALAEKGVVRPGSAGGGKGGGKAAAANPRQRTGYVPTRKGLAQRNALTRRFLQRKLDEFERIKSQIERLGGTLPESDA